MNPGVVLGFDIFLSVATLLAMIAVFKRDLMMLQQNSYRNERYVRWFNSSNESTNAWRLMACVALFLLLINVRFFPVFFRIVFAAIIFLANFIVFTRRKYKKPLTFTRRAVRIYATMLLLGVAAPVAIGVCSKNLYLGNEVAALVIVVSPLFLLLANVLLIPVEKSINARFYNDAQRLLANNKGLKVIGITGSYGKTSTKHFLHHLLKQKYQTLMTPGSFNTLLGVIRTIREHLKSYDEIFIAEMGAKQPGDIKEICDLVRPEIGMVTSIGEQHLETFKTVENILHTKFELVDCLPAGGLAVINDSNKIVDTVRVTNTRAIYYGSDRDSWRIENLRYTSGGTFFTVTDGQGWSMELTTPLIGEANITNLLGCLIVARQLGLSDSQIRYAVSTMPQVEHRLQVTHTQSGFTIIDDAFNSNPVGAAMAVDVLSNMDTPGKKIIITPGMIELGELQFQKNRELGEKIGNSVDIAIIVGNYNKDPLLEGLAQSAIDKDKVFWVASFAEAQQLMMRKVGKGDVVLYENDLPDTFK